MLAELCPLEEPGEAPDGLRARVQARERTLDVLEGRLRRVAAEAGATKCVLHPRIRRDDRTAEIRVVAQVVQGFVEGGRHGLAAARPPEPRGALRLPARE